MSEKREIRCYDYVNHPFQQVCDALSRDPNQTFRSATLSAATRAESVAAGLHVNVAGLDIGREINIHVKDQHEIVDGRHDKFILLLEWEAAKSSAFFPVMEGRLMVYPITSTETQLDFQGSYDPPMGLIGKAMDAVVGHRVAEASVHQFLAEIAAYLRENIS